jgi:hypothetical protein
LSTLLGFEIPTGRRFEIPDEGHCAWIGQTQLSGKTTTFEAIVYRAGKKFKAVAFITKPGESSFLTGRMIPPYFSEPSNDPEQPLWQWVKSILEASQSRKLRFEESWIIRACDDPRPAKTLADVHKNILDLLSGEKAEPKPTKRKTQKPAKWARKPVTGINAGVYTSLKAYFDIVMPQLARLPYSKTLELRPGLNVMDLRNYSIELQSLVIRSVMEHVYTREKNTRVIVPEAQDFVPRGKNSPVKMACENLVRKGGADKNFMWLDSQDIVAVDYTMLRAVSILGCGVQGQINEINRTIGYMFGSDNINPADIGRLNVGEFYVRVPGGIVTKVYVQPAWMPSEIHAQSIAKGEIPVSSARSMIDAFKSSHPTPGVPKNWKGIYGDIAAGVGQAESGTSPAGIQDVGTAELEDDGDKSETRTEEDEMKWEDEIKWRDAKYEALKKKYDDLDKAHDALAERVRQLLKKYEAAAESPASKNGDPRCLKIFTAAEWADVIYARVKEHALKDPSVLLLLATKPELRVNVTRPTIDISAGTLKGNIALLLSEKFFDVPKQSGEIRAELSRRGMLPNGPKTPNTLIAGAINDLHRMGFLTDEEHGWRATPSMKAYIREAQEA